MATAVAKTETKTIEKTVDEKVYVLTLNKTEALIIKSLVGNVIGHTEDSYRKECSDVYYALQRAGLGLVYTSEYFQVLDVFPAKKHSN